MVTRYWPSSSLSRPLPPDSLFTAPIDVARFQAHMKHLNVSSSDLYTALITDAEKTPKNWNIQGRQADVWIEKGI